MTRLQILQKILWSILIVVLATVGIAFIWSRIEPSRLAALKEGRDSLRVYGVIPDFELIDINGKKINRQDLSGNIWITDLIFTRCRGQCPFMTQKMIELQGILPKSSKLKWVSISVDPVWDTPQIMKEYAQNVQADPMSWFFLTGDKEKITTLVRDGFHLALEHEGGGADEPIIHSNRFILIDDRLQIRGLYNATDEEALKNLKRDTVILLNSIS